MLKFESSRWSLLIPGAIGLFALTSCTQKTPDVDASAPTQTVSIDELLNKSYPDCPAGTIANLNPEYAADYQQVLHQTDSLGGQAVAAAAVEQIGAIGNAITSNSVTDPNVVSFEPTGFYRLGYDSKSEAFMSEFVANDGDESNPGCVAEKIRIVPTDSPSTFSLEIFGINQHTLRIDSAGNETVVASVDNGDVTPEAVADLTVSARQAVELLSKK